MPVQSYRDLLIWRKGIELTKEVYRLTRMFPRHEVYGLSSQLQRAAVSVPSNIAEGQARQHTGEFRQFLHHTLGSLAEVDTQLVVSIDLGYITDKDAETAFNLVVELQKMIWSLIGKLPGR